MRMWARGCYYFWNTFPFVWVVFLSRAHTHTQLTRWKGSIFAIRKIEWFRNEDQRRPFYTFSFLSPSQDFDLNKYFPFPLRLTAKPIKKKVHRRRPNRSIHRHRHTVYGAWTLLQNTEEIKNKKKTRKRNYELEEFLFSLGFDTQATE